MQDKMNPSSTPKHEKSSLVHLEMGPESRSDLNAEVSCQTINDEHGQPLDFDAETERRLVRKIDWYIVPTVAILYMFCFIDRANIGNARLAGFEKDLKLRGYDYNTVLSVFYISYTVFEIPSNMACKFFGPGWFLPATTLGFGAMTVAFAFVHDLSTACAVRFLLGIFEAGMLPGIAYYLSRWYKRAELSWRLALYMVMAPIAGASGGLLASGILTLNSFGSTKRWQMIFAIEGIITMGLAVIAFFTLTDRPETARWLTDAEKQFLIDRLKAERPGASEVLDKIDRKKFARGIVNPVTLATSWVFLLVCITVQALAFFLPTIIRTIYPRVPVVRQQLLTVPPYILGATSVLATSYSSWKLDKRNIIIGLSPIPVIVGYIMFLASTNGTVRYAATFLVVLGAFTGGSLCNAQVSANVVSDTARSAAIGTNVMFGNMGGLIATWAFLPFDAPNYPIGNGLNVAVQSVVLFTCLGLEVWMRVDNKRRKLRDITAELDGLSAKEVEQLDWKHPAFQWRP